MDVSKEVIQKFLDTLDGCKSPGLDAVLLRVLKELAGKMAEPD